jgi:putative membrane-bound dehydrogenase-like protein
MFACFDDDGHLYVAESSGLDLYAELQQQTRRCRISRLTDADGDGRFELAHVFAEQLVFPMGLVGRAGKLYAADPPDLITLEDTDGDGRADRRTVILTGFGHTDNGSLHGLTFGPDGWLYLTMGEPDSYALRRRDGSVVSSKAGALLRCRPDGSDVEVISSGFENLVEVVFLPGGEIVGTLNWYSRPEAGVRDALVHLVEGGRYPLKADEPVRPKFFHGEPLPALAQYPAVALSGMELYRGGAFPGCEGDLFTAQFNARKVVRHQLTRAGATFRSVDSDFITTEDPDVHFSDVLEDADGSLLAVDTGSWYTHHCPTGRIRHAPATGGLWRVRHVDAPRPEVPHRRQLDWNHASDAELVQWLNESRHYVRERAQLELGRRTNAVAALVACLQTNRHESARIAAAWALGNQADPHGLRALREVVRSLNDPLAPLAARILARVAERESEPPLQAMLSASATEKRMAAAEALARCGSSDSAEGLWRTLADNPEPLLEHALQFALERVASTASAQAALERSSPAVQRAALIVLDQPWRSALTAPAVASRLDATDARLRLTAQRLLQRHPEWAPEARAALRRLLKAEVLREGQPELLRSLVHHLAADPGLVATVAEFARSKTAAQQTRALLAMLEAPGRTMPAPWQEALTQAFASQSPEVRHAAVRVAAAQTPPTWDAALAATVMPRSTSSGGPEESRACRLDALRALVRREPKFDAARFALLEDCLAPTNSAALRLGAMAVLTAGQPTATQLARIAEIVRTDTLVAPAAFLALVQRTQLAPSETRPVLEFASERLDSGWSLPADQVQWLSGLARDAAPEQREKLKHAAATQAKEQQQQLLELQPLLTGGDATRGRLLFDGKAACGACHRVGAVGSIVGPDLTKIGAVRTGRDLLESIVLPSATFAQSYEPFTATLSDGELVTGIRVPAEDNMIVLRDASGHETRLPGSASLERARVSLMPEGLLHALNPGEIRDLFAYLQSLR